MIFLYVGFIFFSYGAFFFIGLALIFQMTAVSLAKVIYVISIKRLSLILSIFLGAIFFKEEKIKQRLLGGALMVVGAVIISLWG